MPATRLNHIYCFISCNDFKDILDSLLERGLTVNRGPHQDQAKIGDLDASRKRTK